MPKYEIIETITRVHVVEGPNGQRALDMLWYESDADPDLYLVEEYSSGELTGNTIDNPKYMYKPPTKHLIRTPSVKENN